MNEIVKAGKAKNGLVAIQLDIAKAFDTLPHTAIAAAMQRLGLPKRVRESKMDSYKSLNRTTEYGGSRTEVSLMRGYSKGTHRNTPFSMQ
jgi:hypothetical protein